MACCCGTTFNSCADCCPQWTLPGGATAVPTEIQAAVSISPFDVCFTASRNFGFSAPVCAKKDTVSHSGTYTLTRLASSGNSCGSWNYTNCIGNENISVAVRLFYISTEKRCVWDASVAYTRCIPCTSASFLPGGIYNHPDMLCCNGTDYGFKAGARGGSTGFSNFAHFPEITMTFPCQAGALGGSVGQSSGAPSGLTWLQFCNRPGINCSTCGCDSTNPFTGCPDTPISSTITITISV